MKKLDTKENVSIERSTGDISLSDVSCVGKLDITVTTGKTELMNVSCAELDTEGDTGRLVMTNVIASGKLSIERSSGDVRFDGCDAAEIEIDTDTGDVKGSLLTDKVFIYDTDTGKVELPETASGGKCKIETDTGDIIIEIK